MNQLLTKITTARQVQFTGVLRMLIRWLRQHVLMIGALALMGLTVANFVIIAYGQSTYFSGYPFDGPFQLFNALRRLGDGQTPGRDFPFFHGVGVVYAHALTYFLLGSNLFSSELSRWLVSPVCSLVASYIILRGFKVSRAWALMMVVIIHLAFVASMLHLESVIMPRNSLIGVRSFMPLIALSGCLLLIRWSRWRQWSTCLAQRIGNIGLIVQAYQNSRFIGVLRQQLHQTTSKLLLMTLAGLSAWALLLGTEHGLALFGSICLGILLIPLSDNTFKQRLRQLGWFVVGYSLMVLLIFTAATWGHPFAALRYNLVSVPMDQFWYFGSPPNLFISSRENLLMQTEYLTAMMLGVILLVGLVFLRRSGSSILSKNEGWVAIVCILYGLLSTFGYFGTATLDYIGPLWRIIVLLMAALVYRGGVGLVTAGVIRQSVSQRWLFAPMIVAVAVVLWSGVQTQLQAVELRAQEFSGQNKIQGVTLSPEWTAMVGDYDRMFDGVSLTNNNLWSTYAGLLEANHGVFHADTDYVIHALGPQRRDAYELEFAKLQPEFAVTTNPTKFMYESWIQDTSWNFYEDLIDDYQPSQATSHTVVWQRQSDSIDLNHAGQPIESFDPPQPGLPASFELEGGDSTTPRLAVVRLEYAISNPYRVLPIVGNMQRYLIHISGTDQAVKVVSLPPYQTSWEFPVFIRPGQQVVMAQAISPAFPKTSLLVTSASYRLSSATQEDIKALLYGEVADSL